MSVLTFPMLDIQRVTALCLMRERLATGGIIRARLLYIGLCIVLCIVLYIAVYWTPPLPPRCGNLTQYFCQNSLYNLYHSIHLEPTRWTFTSWMYGRCCITEWDQQHIKKCSNRIHKRRISIHPIYKYNSHVFTLSKSNKNFP